MPSTAEQLGQRIKDLRDVRGWSQSEFAQIVGLNKSYIGDIELGRRNPTLRSMERIAGGFDLRIGELLDGL